MRERCFSLLLQDAELRFDSVGAFVLQPVDGPAAGEIFVNTLISQYESGGGPLESIPIPVRVCVHAWICMWACEHACVCDFAYLRAHMCSHVVL